DTNYRSLPNIIRFNNYLYEQAPRLLQQVLNDKVKSEISDEGQRWWCQVQNDDMLIRAYADSCQAIPVDKQENQADQGAIEIVYCSVEEGRYRAYQVMDISIENLCKKIGEWIASGQYEARQIGILVRSNAQALLVIQELMAYKDKAGLNFEVISGDALSLSSSDAVTLIVETLKALVYTSDQHTIHHARMAYLYQLIQHQQVFDPQAWLLFQENDISKLHPL